MNAEAKQWLDDYAATVEFVGMAPDIEDLRRVLWVLSLKIAGATPCQAKSTSLKTRN